MLDAAIVKRITNLREMAMMVVQEADMVLRDTPGESPPGSFQSGLSDAQRAKLLRKRRAAVARSTVQIMNKKSEQKNKSKS